MTMRRSCLTGCATEYLVERRDTDTGFGSGQGARVRDADRLRDGSLFAVVANGQGQRQGHHPRTGRGYVLFDVGANECPVTELRLEELIPVSLRCEDDVAARPRRRRCLYHIL